MNFFLDNFREALLAGDIGRAVREFKAIQAALQNVHASAHAIVLGDLALAYIAFDMCSRKGYWDAV